MRQARCADCSPRFHREAESRPQFCLGAHAAASDLMASMVTVRARAAKTLAEVKVMALSALGRARTLSRSMAAVQPTARSPTKPTAALEDQAEHQELHERDYSRSPVGVPNSATSVDLGFYTARS